MQKHWSRTVSFDRGRLLALKGPSAAASTDNDGAIVVGISHSSGSCDTLVWAAAEAYVRSRTLRIVHAVRWPLLMGGCLGDLPDAVTASAVNAGRLLIDAARTEALVVAPGLRIETTLALGAPSALLVRAAAGGGAMIVLGRGRARPLRRLSTASTVSRVVRTATCPVAVVALQDSEATPAAGRVVALLDGLAESTRTLGFALEAAHRRGVGVDVVVANDSRTEAAMDHLIDRILISRQHQHPDFDVRRTTLPEATGCALIVAARGSALLAVGESMRRQFRRAVFGSTVGALGPV